MQLQFLSAWTNLRLCQKESTIPLSEDILQWADQIWVMEHAIWIILEKPMAPPTTTKSPYSTFQIIMLITLRDCLSCLRNELTFKFPVI